MNTDVIGKKDGFVIRLAKTNEISVIDKLF